ncbi:MAG: V-type ATP synthase subunit D [Hydrogenophilales bacterium]|nr:V-type ATP synthase subunit D [Hydrogenophilales bacterium]
MSKLALNKSSLHRQMARLKIFEHFLPSLDLKRRQVVMERARARQAAVRTREELEALLASVGRDLPMLANDSVDLAGLVRVESVDIVEESLVGIRLPTLRHVEVRTQPYSLLAKPHWVDAVAARLERAIGLRLLVQVQEARVSLLDEAVRRLTQRVNLFEKVLIPQAREDIRRIRIHLADAERARVVQAKIAKRQRLEAAA